MTWREVSKRRGWAVVVYAAVVSALLLVVPSLSTAVNGQPTSHAPPTAAPATSTVLKASVTWDGKNISTAGSTSSAFSIQKGQTAVVLFTFDESSATAVGNASLSVNYLGLVLTTSRVSPHVVGGPPIAAVAELNWSFGPLYDALEGVFQFTASLLSSNGSTIWSDSFYVFTKAPYLVESGAVIVLLVFLVAELYWATSAIRDARRGGGPSKPKTAPPTGETPPPPGANPPSSDSVSSGGSAGPPASPPPSGGSSGGGASP